jgi:hypothetical protein
MQKLPLYCFTALATFIIVMSFAGCHKKVNGINNNTIVETPYVLYFSDTAGQVFYSNDGISIHREVFQPDGFPCYALIVSGNNILFAKNNLYYSSNNGVNFNHSYDSLRLRPDTAVDGLPINLNQSMIIDVPGSPNVMYTTSRQIHNVPAGHYNYVGVAYNNNHGTAGNWSLDNGYDTIGVGRMPVKMISYTLLANGVLAGLAIDSDDIHYRNFYNTTPTDVYSRWSECTGSALGAPSDTNGSPLPPNAAIPDTCAFRYGHFNNRLIAIDMKGRQGAWYSDDSGRIWSKYSGLPPMTPLLCVYAPFEQICLIGTHRHGLYILHSNTGTWEPNNNGLGTNITVRNITAKEKIYKNGVKEHHIFLATDQGIFISKDGGINWTKTIPGNYTTVY